MIITITEMGDATHQRKGKNAWSEMIVKYDSDKGSRESKVTSFSKIWDDAKTMEVGKTYDVKVEKNGKGFWEWVAIKEGSAQDTGRSNTVSTGNRSGGNNSQGYWDERFKIDVERFQFDKDKQPLIIRQSCISSAVASVPVGTDVDEIIERAKQFEAYVNSEADLEQMDIE